MLHPARDAEAQRTAKRRSQALGVGLGSLASTATCAPLLGFLGTIFGILDSFHGIGMEKTAALRMIASAVAEAIVPTALGIVVGAIAAWCHDYLRGHILLLEDNMASPASDDPQDVTTKAASWEVAYDRQRAVSLGIWSYLLYVGLAFARY